MNKPNDKQSHQPSTLGTVAAIAGAAVAGVAVGAAAVAMSDPKKVKEVKAKVNKGVSDFVTGSEDTLKDWKKEGQKIVTDVEKKINSPR